MKVVKTWREVFSKPKYLSIVVLSALVVYIIYFLTPAYGNIISYFQQNNLAGTVKFAFLLFINFRRTILPSSFISMILLSLFTGILISILLYRAKIVKNNSVKKIVFMGAIGVFLGVFAPGCASCGLGIVALLGFSGVFATLPLKGLEVSYLALFILIFSIIQISSKIVDASSCNIILKDGKVKGGEKK